MGQLAIWEKSELDRLESVIESGLKTFVDVGMSLRDIRDKKLYREEYDTFENYCNTKWNLTIRRVQQLMESSRVMENLKGEQLFALPTNEGQTRELANLDPEEQIRVWEQVIDTAPEGKITAAIIKTVREMNKEKAADRREERVEIITKDPEVLSGKYNIIYADPPWKYDYSPSTSREIENNYPTMELEDICNLRVSSICADDSILFLWATSPKLIEAIEVMRCWGFDYRTNMVWVKDKIGMGYYSRQQHELLLIGKRGNLPVPEPENRPSSVIIADRSEHSKKPNIVYGIIENMYPEFNKIELFQREQRPGWDGWGNQ